MSQVRRKSLTPLGAADLFAMSPSRPLPATPPASPAPEASADRRPHFVKLGEAHIFVHPCSVCGAPDAPFGRDVFLRHRKYGTWFCGPCRKARQEP